MTNKVKVLKRDFHLVKKNDGGSSLEAYKYELVEVVNPTKKQKTSGEGAGAEESKEDIVREIPKEEFIRLTTKMFPKWAKDDTKIARFMKNLDPDMVYKIEEMKELCVLADIKDIGKILDVNRGGSHGFGTIIKKTGDTYKLYPTLFESFKKHFKTQ